MDVGLKYIPAGYQQMAGVTGTVGAIAGSGVMIVPSTGTGIIVGAAIISIENQAVRWRDDGVAPTPTVGMPQAAGTTFQYSGNLSGLQFVSQTGTATIDISYYRVSG